MEKELIDAISYVQMSPYRELTLKDLKDKVKIPSKIAKSIGIRTSHVSRSLIGLKEKQLVEVLNPEAKQGRLYKITTLGLEVLKNLD